MWRIQINTATDDSVIVFTPRFRNQYEAMAFARSVMEAPGYILTGWRRSDSMDEYLYYELEISDGVNIQIRQDL